MRLSAVVLLSLSLSWKSVAQVVTTDSLDVMIGQMIMIGIGDFNKVDREQPIFEEIKQGKAGGVVLYEKNLSEKKTSKELAAIVESLQENAEIPLFIGIDEEGGYVSRMKTKYGFPKTVSAQYLGKIDNADSTRFYANQTATLLQSFGINMNYTPVVDLNLNPSNPVIGKIERSYSENYPAVSEQASYVIEEHTKNKVITVVKHFPGHGSSKSDTHLGLADITSTWRIEEIFPYKALLDSGKIQSIMTAHIVNESLDPSKLPATLSYKIVRGLLRNFMGYDGVVVSDDMQMGAIQNEYGIRKAITLSINAGVDVLMFANNVKDFDMVTASTIHAIIKNLVFEGHVTQERIEKSYERIMKLKASFGMLDNDYLENLKTKLRQHL